MLLVKYLSVEFIIDVVMFEMKKFVSIDDVSR